MKPVAPISRKFIAKQVYDVSLQARGRCRTSEEMPARFPGRDGHLRFRFNAPFPDQIGSKLGRTGMVPESQKTGTLSSNLAVDRGSNATQHRPTPLRGITDRQDLHPPDSFCLRALCKSPYRSLCWRLLPLWPVCNLRGQTHPPTC